jgi:hypothetical protein
VLAWKHEFLASVSSTTKKEKKYLPTLGFSNRGVSFFLEKKNLKFIFLLMELYLPSYNLI